MKQLVVNLYGGPGAGKSTQSAEIFAKLKKMGINAELCTEYAKDLTWQESFNVMRNQLYIFAKQHMRLWRVSGKVDVIITDSPLMLSILYASNASTKFKDLIMEEYDKFENINVFLKRPNSYQQHGRTQTLREAMDLDNKLQDLLLNNGYHLDISDVAHDEIANKVVDEVVNRLHAHEQENSFATRGSFLP